MYLKGFELTWSVEAKEEGDRKFYRAECEETGKVFTLASSAQLMAAVSGYEVFAKDVCQILNSKQLPF
jgi:hypothetical protein